MDKWLNRLGQVAMVAIAVAALIVVLRPESRPSPQAPEGYKRGDRIDLSKIPLNGPTLIVATRSTCNFCRESVPFWRTIDGTPIVWLAVGEDASTSRSYLIANGLMPDRVITVGDAGMTKVSATPTMILLDQSGLVIDVWVGMLGSDAQAAVQSRLAALRGS